MKKIRLLQMGFLAAVACLSQSVFAADGNPNIIKDISGVIEYRTTDTNKWRGEDRFRLTVHPDKSMTMRDTTRLDDTLILRDVVTRVDKDYNPIDVHLSHWLDGKWRGTAFYIINGQELDAVVNAPNGILRQTVKVGDKFSIGSRPQATFGWHMGHYDFEKGGKQSITIYIMNRLGDTIGSVLGDVSEYNIELVADEEFEVRAGVFDAWKFELTDPRDPTHEYEVWIEKEHFLTLQLVQEKYKRVYELVELGETYPE